MAPDVCCPAPEVVQAQCVTVLPGGTELTGVGHALVIWKRMFAVFTTSQKADLAERSIDVVADYLRLLA